ncbi:MAG: glycosyltransferase [Burkholderiales bacterium]|nr:glycosyltransferase [Burkholderiales bacterium]
MEPESTLSRLAELAFTVVIPTLDRPDELQRCLRSLAELEFPRDRFEVVIVDDGSRNPVDTNVAAETGLQSVSVIRQARRGPAAARNAGARQSRGRFVAFLDDDCTVDPVWLSELETACEANGDRVLIGGQLLNGFPDNVYAEVGELILDVGLTYFQPEAGSMYFFRAANLAVESRSFLASGGFDPDFRTAEDREFCDRWLHDGGLLVHVPSARAVHYNRQSLTDFCRQHFSYGRGAFLYHRARRERGTRAFRIQFLGYYGRVLWAACSTGNSSRLSKLGLVIIWQLMNVFGFVSEMCSAAVHRIGIGSRRNA